MRTDITSVSVVTVECLRCGERHELDRPPGMRSLQQGECPRCGYVGWAEAFTLSERHRRALRDRPIEARGTEAA